MSPPTFSKSTSMPLGVAATSWADQSSALWSTAASKPSCSVSSAHFSGPPAIPTTRAPSALASWPATEPTAPAAAETTTVSPGFGFADLADPDPGGQPGHPERAHVGARRDTLGDVDRQQRHRVGGDHVLLPADETLHDLTDRIVRILRRDDLAEPARAHDLADPDGRQVGRHVVDPRAVGRIERDPVDADKRLAVADLGDRLLAEFEGVGADAAGGAFAKEEAAVSVSHERTVPDPDRCDMSEPACRESVLSRTCGRHRTRHHSCFRYRAVDGVASGHRVSAPGRAVQRPACRTGWRISRTSAGASWTPNHYLPPPAVSAACRSWCARPPGYRSLIPGAPDADPGARSRCWLVTPGPPYVTQVIVRFRIHGKFSCWDTVGSQLCWAF